MLVRYLKNSIGEYLLLVLMVGCFARTILSGFYTPAELHDNIALLAALAAALCVLLLLGAYSRKASIIAIIAFSAGFAIFVIAVRTSGGGNVFSDVPGNPYLYFVLVLLSSVGIFLLSRTVAGCVALFAGGAVILCMIRFLYETAYIIEFLLFLLAAGAMYVFRNYRSNVRVARTARPVPGRMAATGAVLCALTIAIGCGLFFAVVQPLDPPARDLKLITRYMSLPTLEKLGVAERTEIPDDELASRNTNENEQHAKEGTGKPEDVPSEADKDSEKDTRDKTNPLSLDSSRNPFFRVISFLYKRLGIFTLPVLAAAILLCAVLVKRYRRKKWFRSLAARSPNEQVKEMYAYYMRKFRFIKIDKPPEYTLLEFAERAQPTLERFNAPGSSFRELTDIYVKSCYGKEPVIGEEVRRYFRFHEMFYSNCRAYLGGFGYMVRFFGL
ncbi:MAG: DUF4129 domain-containing protein [Clostridiales Family XIII bacterium]|jgi:hypothetical protein|nr:DUF4129 domain-containing protein [Clostridiales Family XIII bacterium]